jgi:hypothetical protein
VSIIVIHTSYIPSVCPGAVRRVSSSVPTTTAASRVRIRVGKDGICVLCSVFCAVFCAVCCAAVLLCCTAVFCTAVLCSVLWCYVLCLLCCVLLSACYLIDHRVYAIQRSSDTPCVWCVCLCVCLLLLYFSLVSLSPLYSLSQCLQPQLLHIHCLNPRHQIPDTI